MSARMQLAPEDAPVVADSANATVVFLRPGGGGANAIMQEDGRALGEVAKGSKLVVIVPPGRHTFYKGLLMDSPGGDYRLFGPEWCHLVDGDFEAGKIYAVEASLARLFAILPSEPRLATWASLGSIRMTSGGASVTSDPTWKVCQEMARKNEAKSHDGKSTVTAAHALQRWP